MRHLNRKFILIGASTGGPTLIEKIVTALPKSFEATVIVAQHMMPLPLQSFAARLNRIGTTEVVMVESKTVLEKAKVYVLANSAEIVKEANAFYLVPTSKESFYHPSIDLLFASAKVLEGCNVWIYLLTGIGDDGAKALKELPDSFEKIAQSKECCAVYGMPRAALEYGGAKKSMHIDAIIQKIARDA